MNKKLFFLITIFLLIFLMVGCEFPSFQVNKSNEILKEKREIIDLQYIIKGFNHKDKTHISYAKQNRGKFVRWTAFVRTVKKDYLNLRVDNYPEIKASFNYYISTQRKISKNDIITITGSIDKYDVDIFSSDWYLNNCRIEVTTQAEKDFVLNYKTIFAAEVVTEKKIQPTTTTQIQTTIKTTQPSTVKQKHVLGSTKYEVMSIFKNYKIDSSYSVNMDKNAIKFEDKNMIIVVDFDFNGIAEGVSFGAQNWNEINEDNGKGSYVEIHYNELVYLATGGIKTKIETNKTTEYPIDIYIGNLHY